MPFTMATNKHLRPVLPFLCLIISPVWTFIFLYHAAYNIHFSRKHLLSSSHAHSTVSGNSVETQRSGPIAPHTMLRGGGRCRQQVMPVPMQAALLMEGRAQGCRSRGGEAALLALEQLAHLLREGDRAVFRPRCSPRTNST